MPTRLIVLGLVIIAAAVFAFIFWDQISTNQQELARPDTYTGQPENKTPVSSGNFSGVSGVNTTNVIEKDLSDVDLEFDYNSSELEAEAQGL